MPEKVAKADLVIASRSHCNRYLSRSSMSTLGNSKQGDRKPTKFVSVGGVWLDEIHAPGKEVLGDVPGGSVAFGIYQRQRS